LLEKLGRNQLTLINSFHISFFSQIKELNSFPKLTKLANPRTLPNMMTHNQIERMLAPIKSKSMIEKIQ
jgi:site-specific recombinase XerD